MVVAFHNHLSFKLTSHALFSTWVVHSGILAGGFAMISTDVAPQGVSLSPSGPQLPPVNEGLYLSPGVARLLIDLSFPA